MMHKTPKYCKKCGRLLLQKVQITQYNEQTGKPEKGLVFTGCENYSYMSQHTWKHRPLTKKELRNRNV